MSRLYGQIVLLAFVAACGEGVPEEPTYFRDVQPILVARCVRCHGGSPIDSKIDYFRLDRYVAGDDATYDAFDMAASIVATAVQQQTPAMPPDFSLTGRQMQILERWLEVGAPKGERDNDLPIVELIASDATDEAIDQVLSLTLRAWDPDGDGLVVALATRDNESGIATIRQRGLVGGLQEAELDMGQVESGATIDVIVIADDGYSDDPADNQHEFVVLSAVQVDHGARGTAPTVLVTEPNGNESLGGDVSITWVASDPDVGDELVIDIDLLRVAADGSTTVEQAIASGIANQPSFYTWDPSGVAVTDASGALVRYKIRVTATDGQNTRSDSSDSSFTLVPQGGTTELAWADVKPLFEMYCVDCHGQPATNPPLEYFRLDKYDSADPEAPQNSDEGVYEMRGLVYDRLVVAGSMPPAIQPQPSPQEVDQIAEWIAAGAPYGAGAGDPKPSFTWLTPNDTAISQTGDGSITLSWSAVSNPPGEVLTGSIEYAPLNAPSDAIATCDASLTGWTLVTTNVEAGSYAWTTPGQGYFCLRGTVSGDGMATTTVLANKPVKYKPGGPPI